MSEAILDQQEQNNEVVALEQSSPSLRGLHDELDKRTEEKYRAWRAYFDSRPGASKMFARETDPNWNMNEENRLWKEYETAHKLEQEALWEDMNKKLRDPNDKDEDDNVPLDPQEREMNESSNY